MNVNTKSVFIVVDIHYSITIDPLSKKGEEERLRRLGKIQTKWFNRGEGSSSRSVMGYAKAPIATENLILEILTNPKLAPSTKVRMIEGTYLPRYDLNIAKVRQYIEDPRELTKMTPSQKEAAVSVLEMYPGRRAVIVHEVDLLRGRK